MVTALGLGKLKLNSFLNEPFSARIELLSATANELDSLNVSLADSDAFARAKIDMPSHLRLLKFKIMRNEAGADYIQITSIDNIREPYLNFLVEINWSNGRLLREFTVLLDPPTYYLNARKPSNVTSPTAEKSMSSKSSVVSATDSDNAVIYASDFEQHQSDVKPAAPSNTYYSGGDYGPTSSNDTLWSIASSMRPDSSISMNQMMLALLNANPDAFVNNNINGLRKGQILKMPSEVEINSNSQAEALAEVNRQYANWGSPQPTGNTEGTIRPVTAVKAETIDEPAMDEGSQDAELKLLAVGEASGTLQNDVAVNIGDSEGMALAAESIEALTQEFLELKEQLKESEALLYDLKRLLQLKDDEIALLQEQMAEETVAKIEVEESAVEKQVLEDKLITEIAEPVVQESVQETEESEVEVVEETIEVIDLEPNASGGIMDMVQLYLSPLNDMVVGNPLYLFVALGVLVLLILIAIIAKFKKMKSDSQPAFKGDFPEFNSDAGLNITDNDSKSETILPDTEDETALLRAEDDEPDEPYLPEATPVTEKPALELDFTAEDEEEDVDPLQEVNTYLAFEQFYRAEELVRNAINDEPDNAEFHTKLLEVFYTSGDKKSYEEEAKVLNELVNGEGEHWDMAVVMWSELSPNRSLFEKGGDDESDVAEDGDVLDITSGDDGEGLLDVTAAVGLGDSDEAIDEPEEDMLDISGISTYAVEDDISLDLDIDFGEDNGLELDLSKDDGADDEISLDLDKGDDAEDVLSLELDVYDDESIQLEQPDEEESDSNSTDFNLSLDDEIATKLDLAKAYVELGDKDSAKTILDEVFADGNDEQKQQAQELRSQVE